MCTATHVISSRRPDAGAQLITNCIPSAFSCMLRALLCLPPAAPIVRASRASARLCAAAMDDAKAPAKPRARKAEGGDAAPKKAKESEAKAVFERTAAPRAVPSSRPTFKALSWNVAGLRAVFNNGNAEALRRLVADEQPDLLCLQEHKLQASHVAQSEAQLRALLGPAYGAFYWAVSVEKKGYSGVVVILKGPHSSQVGGASEAAQKSLASLIKPAEASAWGAAGAPLSVRYGLGERGAHASEGRCVTLQFQAFAVTCVYVPNSGEGLKRLDYRLKEWETDMRAHCRQLSASKPLLIGGDFNVAHRDEDIYNASAKHILKQAGCTVQERAAFGQLCREEALVDSFPHMHPDARGGFTYWSQRAGNRPWNRGLRLDYWLVSQSLACEGDAQDKPRLHDAFILQDATPGVSDHCVIGVTIQL